MPRPPGRPNNNKTSLLARLKREYPGYHPVVEMARVANDKNLSEDVRFQANKEVAKYVTPQLKAIEHTGGDGAPIRHLVSASPLTLEEWEVQNKEPE